MCAEEWHKYFNYKHKDASAVPEFLYICFSGLWRIPPETGCTRVPTWLLLLWKPADLWSLQQTFSRCLFASTAKIEELASSMTTEAYVVTDTNAEKLNWWSTVLSSKWFLLWWKWFEALSCLFHVTDILLFISSFNSFCISKCPVSITLWQTWLT